MAIADGHVAAAALLRKGLQRLDLSIAEAAIEDLSRYAVELYRWNRKINLVARRSSMPEIMEKHFLDSLTLLPFFQEDEAADGTLLDVGTGAGFPGLVLAVVKPELQVVLVEPRLKRVSFLRHIVRLLKLHNVEIIEDRLQDAAVTGRKNIGFVTCRALTAANDFLGMVTPFMRLGARALLMLGPDQSARFSAELPADFLIESQRDFILPRSGGLRTVWAVTMPTALEGL